MRVDEDALLARWLPKLPQAQDVLIPPGDDCAAIPWLDGNLLLVTVDQVAADTHYHLRSGPPTPPGLIGRKLLARNLSDIAAMGGTPRFAVVATAAARNTTPAWLDEFINGLLRLANVAGVSIIGGDLCAADCHVASLTLLGSVPAQQVSRRNGAQPGDTIVVTGTLGASLQTAHHLLFQPRCREGRWLAQHGFPTAMLDLSDGLLKDLARICMASNTTARIRLPDLPRTTGPGGSPIDITAAITDGEDYELLFTVSPTRLNSLRATWPFRTPITVVGTIEPPDAKEPALLRDAAGRPIQDGMPFDHFA